MNLSFHGAVGGVTGSCYQIQVNGKKFLVDCGMFQGSKSQKELNYKPFAFSPADIDFVLVTHAHIDHTGLLPKLVKYGFKGPIYGTEPTVDFLGHLLPDSARIQQSEVEMKNERNARKGLDMLTPIYSTEDADAALKLLKGLSLDAEFKPMEGVSVKFRNAGHIFGSSFLEMTLTENGRSKKIVFSGDLGGRGHAIVQDPATFTDTDVLLIESTYGNRFHTDEEKEKRLARLAEIVKSTMKAGGNLVIPAFALERTQDLMHDLMVLFDQKGIPEAEVYVDSPLAIEATEVFTRYPKFLDEEATALLKKHGNLFDNHRFKFTKSADESRALNDLKKVIIISSSGMCDAGRIKHHLKRNLWRPESTILFVGFQAEGTIGRLLIDGVEKVRIHGEEVKVEARIEKITGYSGHADQKGLMQWLETVKAVRDKVFVVHGEDEARKGFAQLLKEKRGFNAAIPQMGELYDLLSAQHDETKVVTLPSRDSYNLYADFMLRLSDFMRKQPDETARRSTIEKLINTLEK